MKDKIIVNRKNETNNGYKCDIDKPFRFAEDQVVGVIFSLTLMSTLITGMILLLICTPPPITEETEKIAPLIVFSIIGLLAIPMFTYYSVQAVREKNSLKQMLPNALVLVGTMLFIQREKKGMYRLKVKFEDGNTLDIITKSRFFILNRKIAVARNGNKQFILTKCTLIQN